MIKDTPSKEYIKRMAHNMHEYFKENPNNNLHLMDCYQALSRAFGKRDWAEFSSYLEKMDGCK